MFPYINVPFISNASISDLFSCCVTCQPFGRTRRRSVSETTKPSREVKTISSLVEKFTAGHDGKHGHGNMTPAYSIRIGTNGSAYRPCSRQTSFNLDMNHEKFTPCEKQKFNQFDYYNNTYNNSMETGYGKIINKNYLDQKKYNIMINEKIQEKGIIAPPPRRKRPAPQPQPSKEYLDALQQWNLKRESWKNYRNIQMNNLDQPNANCTESRNYECNNNNLYTCKISNSEYCSVSYVTNNKLIKNNKSGCSKLAVVSDSLESNALQNFSKFDRTSIISNNNNIIIDNTGSGFRQDKVYYKNSSIDKFGNYEHAIDTDEVIVCESYSKDEPKVMKRQQAQDNTTTTKINRPKDSTYTKFYTDNFYQDNFEITSNKSMDEPFERIVQLQPDIAPIFQNALAIIKAKRTSLNKPQEHPPQIQKPGRLRKEKSVEQEQQQEHHQSQRFNTSMKNEDGIRQEDNSIPVVFSGLLPIHQLNGDKWMQSVSEETPEVTLPNGNRNHKSAIAELAEGYEGNPIKHDNNSNLRSGRNNVGVKVVASLRKELSVIDNTAITSHVDISDEGLTSFYDRRINSDECQYAGMDKCEL